MIELKDYCATQGSYKGGKNFRNTEERKLKSVQTCVVKLKGKRDLLKNKLRENDKTRKNYEKMCEKRK